MLTCMTIAAQAVADAHVYKRTNNTLIEAARLEEESKSRRKGQNSKARVLNEWIRSQEHMEALMEDEIKALSSIHLDIFRYSTASQLIIDRINQQAAKEAEQVAKEVAKETAKRLTILRRQATKDENDLCKAFRSLADAGISELQSFRSSPKKSPRKSPQKTTIHVLDAPHLRPPTASCITSSSPSWMPSPPPPPSPPPSPISKSKRQRKGPLRRTIKTTVEDSSEHEAMATPIEPRVSRTGRIIKPPRR